MPLKHKIYFALAFVHIIMVALFATHFTDWGVYENKAVKALSVAGNYTGSNNIFSFFAPGLSDQPYVIYAVKNNNGQEQFIDLKGHSPEFANRINNIYGYLTLPEARAVLSASLANHMKQQYTDAEKIRVAMVIQQIPTMEAFRGGKRNTWQFWFHRDFGANNNSFAQQ